jgi:hypothetical protein
MNLPLCFKHADLLGEGYIFLTSALDFQLPALCPGQFIVCCRGGYMGSRTDMNLGKKN